MRRAGRDDHLQRAGDSAHAKAAEMEDVLRLGIRARAFRSLGRRRQADASAARPEMDARGWRNYH